jgi:hypothetical protein
MSTAIGPRLGTVLVVSARYDIDQASIAERHRSHRRHHGPRSFSPSAAGAPRDATDPGTGNA